MLLFPSHRDANIWIVVLSTIFSIPFMSLVVTKLPIFRSFYRQHHSVFDDGRRSSADQRAAPPMAGLVTGGAIALILLPTGVSNIIVPAFCGGIGASVMSFYHEPP